MISRRHYALPNFVRKAISNYSCIVLYNYSNSPFLNLESTQIKRLQLIGLHNFWYGLLLERPGINISFPSLHHSTGQESQSEGIINLEFSAHLQCTILNFSQSRQPALPGPPSV